MGKFNGDFLNPIDDTIGPLLFNIFINDLAYTINKCNLWDTPTWPTYLFISTPIFTNLVTIQKLSRKHWHTQFQGWEHDAILINRISHQNNGTVYPTLIRTLRSTRSNLVIKTKRINHLQCQLSVISTASSFCMYTTPA